MQVTGLSERYKISVLVVAVFIAFFSQTVRASSHPDANVHMQLNSGLHSLLSQDYDQALSKFRTLSQKYPQNPLGYIYMAAVKIAEAADYEEPFEEQFIESNLDKAEVLSKRMVKENPADPWAHYFLAITYGYSAYLKALKENYVSAFSQGMSSISSFEKCLEKDSSFYDAYIALGAYKYWKSEKADWLPFVSDERSKGIKLLIEACRHKTYNHYLALNSLIWIYINRKQPQKAAEIAKRGLNDYPQSRFFRWGLARAYQDFDKWKAIYEYKELLSSVVNAQRNNRYNEIVLKHKIAMLYHEVGHDDEALKLCNEILQIKGLKDYVSDKLDGRIDRVRDLKKELSGG